MTENAPSPLESAPPQPTGQFLPATLGDLNDIKGLMLEAQAFKMSRGDDIWGDDPFTDEEVGRMIVSGNMFVYKQDDVTAASVIILDNDERIWGEKGLDGTALYIHKLCVSNAFRGQKVADKVFKQIALAPVASGKTSFRGDCPSDNRPLCEYYESLGFSEVRRYERPSSPGRRNSQKTVYKAALYQKDIDSVSKQ